jgi:hypothetical protein
MRSKTRSTAPATVDAPCVDTIGSIEAEINRAYGMGLIQCLTNYR